MKDHLSIVLETRRNWQEGVVVIDTGELTDTQRHDEGQSRTRLRVSKWGLRFEIDSALHRQVIEINLDDEQRLELASTLARYPFIMDREERLAFVDKLDRPMRP
jgi:ABC-type branched-subunit amino acid transport system ATPase component